VVSVLFDLDSSLRQSETHVGRDFRRPATHRRQPATGRTRYGLGFNVPKVNAKGEGVRVRHTGASGTFAQLDFENDLIFVLLTQVPQTQTQPSRDGLLKAVAEVFSSADSAAN
jgi:CubicO group peptidase (beta-lactamase class C family)